MINLGNAAIHPVESSKDVFVGGSVSLSVYVAGDPPIASSEIVWRSPSGELLTTGSRVYVPNERKQLTIQDVVLTDSGTYHVGITRNSSLSAAIHLNVLGK